MPCANVVVKLICLDGQFEHVVFQISFDVVEVIDITYVVSIATPTKGKIKTNGVSRKC